MKRESSKSIFEVENQIRILFCTIFWIQNVVLCLDNYNLRVDQVMLPNNTSIYSKEYGEARNISEQERKSSIVIIPKHQFWIDDLVQKLSPLFSVIPIWGEKCWTTGYDYGTCHSRRDCLEKGGIAQGHCAGGFGVCCQFIYSCESWTPFNRTYFLNPNFPADSHAYGACQHSITKLEDICQLRLDFELFELEKPGENGVCETDELVLIGTDFYLPPLCGDLSGHHLYLPVGLDPQITVSLSISSGWARWKIRTTKLSCTSNLLSPGGCLQYYTSLTGRITSFNYEPGEDSNLNQLNYGVCVRRSKGICAIKWTVCRNFFSNRRKRRSTTNSEEAQNTLNQAVQFRDVVMKPEKSASSGTRSIPKSLTLSRSYSEINYMGIGTSRPNFYGSNEFHLCGQKPQLNTLSAQNRNPRNISLLELISCRPAEVNGLTTGDTQWKPFFPKERNYFYKSNLPLESKIGDLTKNNKPLYLGTENSNTELSSSSGTDTFTKGHYPVSEGETEVSNLIKEEPVVKEKSTIQNVDFQRKSVKVIKNNHQKTKGNFIKYKFQNSFVKPPFQYQKIKELHPNKFFSIPNLKQQTQIVFGSEHRPNFKPSKEISPVVKSKLAFPTKIINKPSISSVPLPQSQFGLSTSFVDKTKIKLKPNIKGGQKGFSAFGKPNIKSKPNIKTPIKAFAHFGRPKVKARPKPKLKQKNQNCRTAPSFIPIPLPLPLPVPILPPVVVPFPLGAGGGGGGGGGGGEGGDDEHKGWKEEGQIYSTTEPYLIRIATNSERDDGLSPFCMEWEQISCDSWNFESEAL